MHAIRYHTENDAADIAAAVMAARDASRAKLVAVATDLGWWSQDGIPDYAAAAAQIKKDRAAVRRIRRAKWMAKSMGLAYWPALIMDDYAPDIDPVAYVAAENAMMASNGLWSPADGTRGGWDSKGHHGVSRYDVAGYWYAAGCRDTPKFRTQVRLRTTAKKGDSLPFLINYARGQKWLLAWSNNYGVSRKAVAALGRLCPESRHAAMRGVPDDRADHPIRVRDLNWAEVRRIQALRVDPSPRAMALRAVALPPRPAAVVLGRAATKKMTHPIGHPEVIDLCPSYPTVSPDVARRIVDGESPSAISGGVLTRKEAHAWLTLGGPASDADIRRSVISFITRELPLKEFAPRDPVVARWLVNVRQRGAWGSLTKIERHPDGRAMCRMDVLDEITPEDLDRGITTGVERAFDNAAQRHSKIREDDAAVICRNPFGKLPRWMAVLTTPAALAAEGKTLSHCVGGYADQVRKGQCLIVSIASSHGRSTAEIRHGQEWSVAQHKGKRNLDAPKRHQQLLRAFLARVNSRRVNRIAA